MEEKVDSMGEEVDSMGEEEDDEGEEEDDEEKEPEVIHAGLAGHALFPLPARCASILAKSLRVRV